MIINLIWNSPQILKYHLENASKLRIINVSLVLTLCTQLEMHVALCHEAKFSGKSNLNADR